MDFTLNTYRLLLEELKKQNYAFQTLKEFCSSPEKRVVVLRHDIDKKPQQALKFAKIEAEEGICASYYFRNRPYSWDRSIVKEIYTMKHEIGYHYENLSDFKGDYSKAIEDFIINLNNFRQEFPIETICMHGSPLSKWDNKSLWEKSDYKKHGIIAEPYFDIDYNEVLYLTDTGRTWNNKDISIRDKVNTKLVYNIKSTYDLIRRIQNNESANKLIINTHPQRWHNRFIPWVLEYVLQNTKNLLKRICLRLK